MTEFDQKKAYVAQGDNYFDDGREIELLHFLYQEPEVHERRGSPAKVLAGIDEYGRTKNFLMNVGQDKGKIVTDLIEQERPKVMVELGGYVGYSAVLFADAVRRAGGKRYYSLERNPVFAAVVMAVVDLAGLSDVVKVIVGPSDQSLRRLHEQKVLEQINFLFLDHYKPAYVTDLKLCEELGLIRPGSILAADNVIKPGNPPYLEYVRSSVEEKRKRLEGGGDDQSGLGQQFPERTQAQYKARVGDEKLSTELRGNPKLVYESKLVNSFEPTGQPVSPSSVRARVETTG
ncbi:MAG: hypothetical protein M1823_003186 [Watsoniomyces obsoletus]|nr:MAG: hypothetical protein M1823_003186 [Watsoniomyces obsoletus]